VKIHISKQQYIKAAMVPLLFFVVLSTIFYSTLKNEITQSKNKEKGETIERFLHYRSQTENLFNLNVNLLRGYVSYINSHPEATDEQFNIYLSNLIIDKNNLIKNISTVKGTKVIAAYPIEGNEKIIGVDLAKIPGQSENVLKVKNEGKQILQGPIKLVQGGQGFILRTPVINDLGYWGQVSIVIDADKFIERAISYSKQNNLEISIFNNEDFKTKPFLGDINILKKDPIMLNMELENNIWKVAIIPKDGWGNSNIVLLIKFLFSVILIFIFSLIIYSNTISQLKLKSQIIHDHLTGLYTRAFLDEFYQMVFERAIRNSTKVGVLLLDINDFKEINDTYGHKVGDEILKLISDKLLKVCRKSEAAFRIGGDEFLIIVSDIRDISEIELIKKRILKAVNTEYLNDNNKINISTSVGSASYPLDGSDFDNIAHAADEDMYRQKILFKKNRKI
jgi:diguanylate cyclase (GGDEF)-like protein